MAAISSPAWSASTVSAFLEQVQIAGVPDSVVPGAEQNASQSGTYATAASLTHGIIAAGTTVSDYYLHSDPVVNSSVRYDGSITFNADILGVISTSSNLFATDSIFGAAGVAYPPMTWEVDDLRIITASTGGFDVAAAGLQQQAATAEPGTLFLLPLGLLAAMWARKYSLRPVPTKR